MNATDKYREILEFIYKKLPMYHMVGAQAYKVDTGNIVKLCERNGNPQNKFRSIHVAGTNGKGSLSHMMAGILGECGYRTGLFTSPHLLDFRERIRVNGKMVSREFVVDYIEENKQIINETEPSFFEITTAMAFTYFALEKVDFAIVETGLGGRLDSTNILKPEISIITNASLDHEHILGNTPEKIAFEKAGIIKYNTPVIFGEKDDQTSPVFTRTAFEKHAPFYFTEDYFQFETAGRKQDHIIFRITDRLSGETVEAESDLPGTYQGKNVVTALKCVEILKEKGVDIPTDRFLSGISHVKASTGLRGRWDIVGHHPRVVCDISHNPAALQETMAQLKEYQFNKLHIVFGISADKNLDLILGILRSDAVWYFCKSSVPRGLDAGILHEKAAEAGLKGDKYGSVEDAYYAAKTAAGKEDFILVTGSNFIVADFFEKVLHLEETDSNN